jgi:hypothetical protein
MISLGPVVMLLDNRVLIHFSFIGVGIDTEEKAESRKGYMKRGNVVIT